MQRATSERSSSGERTASVPSTVAAERLPSCFSVEEAVETGRIGTVFLPESARKGKCTAPVGQAAAQAPHFVQRARSIGSFATDAGSIPSGQTSRQIVQGTPWVMRVQRSSLAFGRKKRLRREASVQSAPKGQKREHQRRRTRSSSTRKPANQRIAQFVSLNSKSRQSATVRAKVRPTGQMRQKTGKPKTALEARAPPKIQ